MGLDYEKNKSKSFGIIEVLIIVVIVGLIGLTGWFIWQKRSSNTSDTSTNSTSSSVSTNTTQTSNVKIDGLGIVINDPENRGLQYYRGQIGNPMDDTMADWHLVRDSNDEYFAECEYPVAITKITEEIATSYQRPGQYYEKLIKKIGNQWYRVGPGTHFQSSCKSDDATNDYEYDLQLYIVNNMRAL